MIANNDSYGPMLHDLLLNMGKLQGSLDSIQLQQQNQISWMAKLDDRLRHVERKAAVTGMLGGGLVTICLTILVELFKSKMIAAG